MKHRPPVRAAFEPEPESRWYFFLYSFLSILIILGFFAFGVTVAR